MHFWIQVLSRFGALAKILTNQGTKFRGEFQQSCEKALIDHRTISQKYLEVDMLTKWMVQMVKQGLRKYGIHKGHIQDWDLQLPWLTMGYTLLEILGFVTIVCN